MKSRELIILDNGSKRAEAVLQLRRVAHLLGEKMGRPVKAVSLQHSVSIQSDLLNGEPAWILNDYLQHQLQQGIHEFSAIPLFFGNSRALTSFVPDVINKLLPEYPQLDFELAEVIYPLPHGESLMVDILYDHVLATNGKHPLQNVKVVLVDHGSPSPRVTRVRNHVAGQLSSRLPDCSVEEAVMERRQGSEYDFNGPLLSDYLDQQATDKTQRVIVAMMFFLPGRHAGAGGDVNDICQQAMQRHPNLDVRITPLIAEHDSIVEILYRRAEAMGAI